MAKRKSVVVLGINGGLLLALLVLNLLVPPPEADPLLVPLARVGSVVGQVEVKRSGSDRWSEAAVGQVLSEGDEIRTALFSESVLRLKGKSSVIVSPNTSFVIGKDLVERFSFELDVGQITAAIPRDSDRQYDFLPRGSDAVASARRGEFSVTTDGKGTVVVDTRAGEVRLSAKGEQVLVKRGRRSVVLPNRQPSRVLLIPSSVALQVKWPPTKLDRTRTKVSGITAAGALVLVNGMLVRADQDGRFSLDVPLQEGGNRLVVNTTDPAGNTTTRESPEIMVDTNPPEVRVEAKDLWK